MAVDWSDKRNQLIYVLSLLEISQGRLGELDKRLAEDIMSAHGKPPIGVTGGSGLLAQGFKTEYVDEIAKIEEDVNALVLDALMFARKAQSTIQGATRKMRKTVESVARDKGKQELAPVISCK